MSNSTTRRELLLAALAMSTTGLSEKRADASGQFRVAVTGDYENLALKVASWEKLGGDAEVVAFHEPFRSPEETVGALQSFDAVTLMRERTPMPREVLAHLPRLKLIVFSGLFDNNLDVAAAADHNIIVCRAMGMQGGSGSVSELTMALMLGCAWHVTQAFELIRHGGWAFQPGIPMRGKVLGIVGYGRIGRPVGQYGVALGMRVLGFSRSLTDGKARADGVYRADLGTLLRTADVVSIHLPLTSLTKGIIGAKEIDQLKRGVIFVNTARAAIVDEQPFFEALRTRKIAMAGLDVFWEEPLPPRSPLLTMQNVVMTPHIGYVTEAGLTGRYNALLDVLLAFRQGKIVGRYTPTVAR